MPSTTATVETLTAEVRVLMVGSRQVTMSVAKQLDEVAPDDIIPFGRISTGTKNGFAEANKIEVIGRSEEDGSLVRSKALRMRYRCDGSWEGSRIISSGQECIYKRCGKSGRDHDPYGHVWYSKDSQFEEWRELPLIVLAGLR